ncbi:MAG TPA: Zn-ribbon containing protein [Candidatus Nanoarchaeia archaeon]|nr:Zn-ribbon containing protein [Candidatus Nanoarchaeia archaeon]
MPYKCVHCSAVYRDEAEEVLNGCSSNDCRSKFFFYIKDQKLKEIEQMKESEVELNIGEKKQMERDVRELTGIKDEETPVFLDFESIRIVKPGKYLLDVQKLFENNKPRIYKLADGKYIIDLNLQVAGKK